MKQIKPGICHEPDLVRYRSGHQSKPAVNFCLFKLNSFVIQNQLLINILSVLAIVCYSLKVFSSDLESQVKISLTQHAATAEWRFELYRVRLSIHLLAYHNIMTCQPQYLSKPLARYSQEPWMDIINLLGLHSKEYHYYSPRLILYLHAYFVV